MAKILVVDDDQAMRSMVRSFLEDAHEIVDTGEPEHALALALEHKPDAILLDLRMPRYSGFELCQTLTSFSITQLIPIIVISGESGGNTKQFCREIGAVGYFEKPIDFEALSAFLTSTLQTRRLERRREPRVRLRVSIKLRGKDANGQPFDVLTVTENVSKSGFFCACNAQLESGVVLEVTRVGTPDEYVGKAATIRSEWHATQFPYYGFCFVEKSGSWVLD